MISLQKPETWKNIGSIRWPLLVIMVWASLTTTPSLGLTLDKQAQVKGIVWGMTEIKPGSILFTLKEGKAGVLELSSGDITWLSGLPEVYDGGQGGLLDVAAHKGWLYFTYAKPGSKGANTTLARAQLKGKQLTQWQDLLITQSASNTRRHFGSRIAFDHQGHLYFGAGDRGHRPNGQDLSSHAGTIMRLNLDGSVPEDNPFVNNKNALPEIWSYGHRNPQGLCFDKASGRLWSSEHGPRGGDEINLIEPAKNYGWPVVSHGREYGSGRPVGEATSKAGMEDPRHLYIPSIAPGSLLCYRGDTLPELKNHLLLGALKLAHLNAVKVNSGATLGNETRWFENEKERMRSLMQDSQGNLYIGTDRGRIFLVKP